MKQIKFSSSTGKVKIEWNFDGDYIVRTTAKLQGYSGHSDGHVIKDEFEEFAKDIVELSKTRKGEAKFESAHPGDFEVIVQSVDGVGHMGVFGQLNFSSPQNRNEVQGLKFSLEFPPEQLELAAKSLYEIAL